MSTPEHISVSFVTPGGVATEPFADPQAATGTTYLTMRVTPGLLATAEDGLLAELESCMEPIPWASKAVRQEALDAIAASKGLSVEKRDALTQHVRKTPCYGFAE